MSTPISCRGSNRDLSNDCLCSIGYEMHPISNECVVKCNETCLKCDSLGNCIECELGKYLDSDSNTC